MQKRRLVVPLLFIIILTLTCMLPKVSAQTANIQGYVLDRKGVGVPSASVSLRLKGSKVIAAQTTTAANGYYSMNIAIGALGSWPYIVTAAKNGYESGSLGVTVSVTLTFPIGIRVTVSPTPANVQINAYPIVSTNGPYTAEASDPISFSSAGSSDPDGSIAKYEWSFGDGNSSTAANPTYAYKDPGTYTVRLTVTDNTNLVTYVTTTSTIAAKQPVADPGGPYSGGVDKPISFNATGSYDLDGTIDAYFWDFGDGNNSTEANATHAYTNLGNFTVTLTVTDNHNASTTSSTWIYVIANPPVADAGGPYMSTAVDPVNFDSSGSHDPDGTIVEYVWDFGDGGNSTEANPTHVYTLQGNYTVTLTVVDNDDATVTAYTWCNVSPRPPLANANGPYSGITGEPIAFSAAGSEDLDGEIVEYRWSFDDGTGSFFEENPSHTFTEPATYTVSLTVTDSDGLTHTVTAECVVELPPNVMPTSNANGPYEAYVKEAVSFSSVGSDDEDGEIVSYEWDFGDGGTSSESNPTHEFEDAGTYTVTLTVTDDREGTATSEAVCTISKKPLPILPIFGVLVAVGAAAAYYFLKMRKPVVKPPKPTAMSVTADSTEIVADGRSTSQITIELVDDSGNPIKVEGETEVNLSTTLGSITSPVKVNEGDTKVTATLLAGTEVGTFVVTAEAKGLKSGSVNLVFTEKKRYCMHCGTKMTVEDTACPKCGLMPPSGVDVKECKNCSEVIPSVAKYCSECGARQPEVEMEDEGL